MNIAEAIKHFHAQHKGLKGGALSTAVAIEAEEKAASTEQDWDKGVTKFIFADGSVIVLHEWHISTYGCDSNS